MSANVSSVCFGLLNGLQHADATSAIVSIAAGELLPFELVPSIHSESFSCTPAPTSM